MIKEIYVSLPTKDIANATKFYTGIGFEQVLKFSGPTFSQFKITDSIFLMLHSKDKSMLPSNDLDSTNYNLISSALCMETSDEIEDFIKLADKAGATVYETQDNNFMYSRSFSDLDGHAWTLYYLK